MRSSAARAYALLFFLSGATGLVYELLWVRLLYQAFGSTIQSVTTVVAAYMGGLGLGAWLLGRRADHHPRPAALYGRLEIAIGVFGLVSPLVLALVHQGYVAAAGAWHLSGEASVALRFGLAALVLLVPTTLMGGTLPVLTRAFTGADRARPGLFEQLQRDCRVTVCGPTTLSALLNSLQMGFRTLAIERRTSEVWQVLAAVKSEFGKFAEVLASTKRQLQAVANSIDQAETRTRQIERKLKDVEALPEPEEQPAANVVRLPQE